MTNSRQIKIITEKLQKDKDKYLFELTKINKMIESKKIMIGRMENYQSDYLKDEKYTLSKSVALLNQNMNQFVNKIDLIIEQARCEILSLEDVRKSLLEMIDKINQKMDLMAKYSERHYDEYQKQEQKREQRMIDDLAATMNIRSTYD